jgi:hypothetical protein
MQGLGMEVFAYFAAGIGAVLLSNEPRLGQVGG